MMLPKEKQELFYSIFSKQRYDHPGKKNGRSHKEINVRKRGTYYPNPSNCTGIRNLVDKNGVVFGVKYNNE